MSSSGEKQRLAAILAADVVGYSRLMTADERRTVASLDAARAIFRSEIEGRLEACRALGRPLDERPCAGEAKEDRACRCRAASFATSFPGA